MRKLTILLIITAFTLSVTAQEATTDSVETTQALTKRQLHRQKVAKRNFHYNILGGPGYTPDFGVLVGGSILMTFRTDPEDLEMRRSVLPVAVAYMFDGGINVLMKPQIFFRGDKFRIFGQIGYKNTLENFYGVGYSTNRDYERSEETSEYNNSTLQFNPWFLFRLGESNVFLGPQIDLNYSKFTDPGELLATQEDWVRAGGDADGYEELTSGIGFLLSYDTRDVPANPYSGVYVDFRGIMYQKWLGSDENFYRIELDYRQYKSVGNRKVLAWTAQTKNVFGDKIPLGKYALSGSPFDLRGYYMGQYRDKTSHLVMMEYRWMFNNDRSTKLKRLLYHTGFVAWGGAGFIGPQPTKIEGVLPNAGLGFRIELQPRMNLRLDYGRNFRNKENLFYFNMTEAF